MWTASLKNQQGSAETEPTMKMRMSFFLSTLTNHKVFMCLQDSSLLRSTRNRANFGTTDRGIDPRDFFRSTQPLQTQHSKPMQKDITAVSSIDEESKWSVHYTAPWHQQENVFLPGSRPPCVEEMHCQAKVNLKTVLRECDKLRKDGFRSSQYYSQGPTFSSPLLLDEDGQLDRDEMEKKKESSETSPEEEKLVYSFRPQTPYLDNISDINNLNSWSECLPLPTPEEKMRQQALSVTTDIVPINITGENFDRQASFRRSTSNTDTIIRRSKRVKRRKTITGVPDSIKRESANNEQSGFRTQSMNMAGQHSTRGDVGSINSSLQHLVTQDSGCQTDDSKIVPPSVRKIRSQKGSGFITQIANLSVSSSGSNSNMNDCNIYTYQFNSSDQGFHSLPRQNNQICLQKFEAICSSTPYLSASGSTSSLPYQVTIQHACQDTQNKSDLRNNTTVSSGSDDVHGFQDQNGCHTANSSYMAHHSSILYAGIVLQNARNSSVHASQSIGTEETPLHCLSTCSSDHPYSSSGTSCSASSSGCQSQASLHMATETGSQCEIRSPQGPCGVYEDSDMSESSIYGEGTMTINHWTYKHASVDRWTSSCSSPTSNACNSVELSPSKTDTSSLFSIDTEECSSSMHLRPDHKSYSHSCINEASNTRHNLYKCREEQSPDDGASLQSNLSLTRSISLRKAKKPPLPPRRTDSLPRKPQRKPYHNKKLLNEQQISSLHESLKSHSATYSGQIPLSGLENTWKLCPRSQSSVSVASSEMSAPADACLTTPTHSDSSSQHSEYTESWDFHMDYPNSNSEHGPSPQIKRLVLSKENLSGSINNEITFADCINSGINSNMAASPDKVQLTSPSSGYSSQSITPTVGTPVTVLRTKSLAGRPKPKVPERKSSLRSSVSFHSIPLSSNRSLPTPPPPKTLPGLVTSQSILTGPLLSLSTSNVPTITPCPLARSSSSEEKLSSSPVTSTIPEQCKTSTILPSETFSPTSEVSSSLMLVENKISAPPLPPPSPLSSLSSVLQAVTMLKTNSSKSLDTISELKELHSSHSYKPARQERPVITAQALQRVQLRPIKLINLENIFTDIITTVCGSENLEHNKEARTCTDKPVETEIVKQVIASDILSKDSTPTMLVSSLASSDSLKLSPDTGPLCSPTHTDFPQSTATCLSNDTLQYRRSPTLETQVSNAFMHQTTLYNLDHLEDTGSEMSIKPENMTSMSPTCTVIQHELKIESDSQNSTPVSPRRHSVNSIPSDSLSDSQLIDLTLRDQDIRVCDTEFGLSDKDPELSDEKCITDDRLSSSSGSFIFKEEEDDENDAVFDSGTDSSSPMFSTGENIKEMIMPARPRTIDDLFAAIHRSKRKVLGRCNFEKERPCTFIPSPPISPTSSSPSINLMHHQSSNIQCKPHRSTTSNDSFKALLLKKGSRSEPGFRMSATEMLKFTDPRLQRSSAEASSICPAQCTSPGRSRRAYEEWARTEGALPRLSPLLTHSKYGRASTPPCAASSRYNSRSRIPSGPMTVICEREGELTESIDCCNISFPVSLSSSAIVCSLGST